MIQYIMNTIYANIDNGMGYEEMSDMGYCTNCGAEVSPVEPDQDAGYCPSCNSNEVKSAFILLGII